jgi:hypothetical protein
MEVSGPRNPRDPRLDSKERRFGIADQTKRRSKITAKERKTAGWRPPLLGVPCEKGNARVVCETIDWNTYER